MQNGGSPTPSDKLHQQHEAEHSQEHLRPRMPVPLHHFNLWIDKLANNKLLVINTVAWIFISKLEDTYSSFSTGLSSCSSTLTDTVKNRSAPYLSTNVWNHRTENLMTLQTLSAGTIGFTVCGCSRLHSFLVNAASSETSHRSPAPQRLSLQVRTPFPRIGWSGSWGSPEVILDNGR